jgi:hypothetical protein
MDTIFRKLEATLCESRPKAKKAKPMPATNSANEIRIIQAAEENPRVSQTVLALLASSRNKSSRNKSAFYIKNSEG